MRKRRVILLGATGSIGKSAIAVAEAIPDRMEIVGMAAYGSAQGLAQAANRLRPEAVCLVDENQLGALRSDLCYQPTLLSRRSGLVDLIDAVHADLVLVAIIGTAGLEPALHAIQTGHDIAVASKEILVMAGEIVMREAARKRIQILPVDSEHNAIFQCLDGRERQTVRKLILTASGGPFRTWEAARLQDVTVEEALRHPTWKMGPKITIDSATLFNKGLEMIEARWLFDVEMDRVEVVVHPQSIVHSLVEFVDGSQLAQLSHSDMCFPIQFAVTWPERVAGALPTLSLAQLGRLDFEEPRYSDFPALNLAREAGRHGGIHPAVLNAANEVAVAGFLAQETSFPAIWKVVEETLDQAPGLASPNLDDIIQADAWARAFARERLSSRKV